MIRLLPASNGIKSAANRAAFDGRALFIKTWKHFQFEQCLDCGSDVEVFSDTPEGVVSDGDDIRCTGCGFMSVVSVDDEEVWIQD